MPRVKRRQHTLLNQITEQEREESRVIDVSAEPSSVALVSSVFLRTLEVFGDGQRAMHWITEENPTLHNSTPLQALFTEQGRTEVYNILGRIEHGVIS